MLYFDVIAGVLMIVVAIVLLWSVRPVDGKVNPKLSPAVEPYAAVVILGLGVFGLITALFGLASLLA